LESKFGLQISHDAVVFYEFEPFSWHAFYRSENTASKSSNGKKIYFHLMVQEKKKKKKKKQRSPNG